MRVYLFYFLFNIFILCVCVFVWHAETCIYSK